MSSPPTPVLGLIGGIGAGKSTAARLLAAMGGGVVDCDRLGHAALLDPAVRSGVVARFGAGVLGGSGEIDRRALGRVVFASAESRAALEAIVFPAIRAAAEAELARLAGNPAARFRILDAAVLLEAGWHTACTKIVYIDADDDLRAARVLARNGWDAAELRRREAAQWPRGRKIAASDAVVPNNDSATQLNSALARLLTDWGWPARPPDPPA